MESRNSLYTSTNIYKDQNLYFIKLTPLSISLYFIGTTARMTSTESPTPAHGLQVHDDRIISSQTQPQSIDTALRLPDIPELLTHLKLIDAIICLKNAIDIQGEAYGKEAGKAWDDFCRAAAVKFIDWAQNVDVSDKTIPIPPLDILMIWHSYMLNTKDYVQFQDKARRGELAGKSFHWQDLVRYRP